MQASINATTNYGSKSFSYTTTRVSFADEFIALQTPPDCPHNNSLSTLVTDISKMINSNDEPELKLSSQYIDGLTAYSKTDGATTNGNVLVPESPIIPSGKLVNGVDTHYELIHQIHNNHLETKPNSTTPGLVSPSESKIQSNNPFRFPIILSSEARQNKNQELKSIPYSQTAQTQPLPSTSNSLPINESGNGSEKEMPHDCKEKNVDNDSEFSFLDHIPSRKISHKTSSTSPLILEPTKYLPVPEKTSELRNRPSLSGNRPLVPDDASDNSPISSELERWKKRVHSKLAVDEEFRVNIIQVDLPPKSVPEPVTSAQLRQAKKNGKGGWGPKLIDIGINTIPRSVSHLSSALIPSPASASKDRADSPQNSGSCKSPGLRVTDMFSSIKFRKGAHVNSTSGVTDDDQSHPTDGTDKSFLDARNRNSYSVKNSNSSEDTMYDLNGSGPSNGHSIIPSYSGSSVYECHSSNNYKESASIDEYDDSGRKLMDGLQGIISESIVQQSNLCEDFKTKITEVPINPVSKGLAATTVNSDYLLNSSYSQANPMASFNSVRCNYASLFDDSDRQEGSSPINNSGITSGSTTESEEKKTNGYLRRRPTIAVRVRDKFKRRFDIGPKEQSNGIQRDEESSGEEEKLIPENNNDHQKPGSGGLRSLGRGAYKKLTMSRNTLTNGNIKMNGLRDKNSAKEERGILTGACSTESQYGAQTESQGQVNNIPESSSSSTPRQPITTTQSENKLTIKKAFLHKLRFYREITATETPTLAG